MEGRKMSRDAIITCKFCQGTELVGKGKKEASIQTRNMEYLYEVFVRIRPIQICHEKSVVTIGNF